VIAEKLLKRFDHAQGAFANHFRGAGLQQPVLIDRIDDLFVALLDTQYKVAQCGVGGQRLGCLVQKLLAGLGNSFFGWLRLSAGDTGSLDIFWLKDDSLEDAANLPAPDVIAAEIVEDLQAALDEFALIAEDLRKS
jgi:hypothetical protein